MIKIDFNTGKDVNYTGKKIDSDFMYKAMVALKLSRDSYNYKEDNILDAVAYLAAYNNKNQNKLK